MTKIDFYILEQANGLKSLHYACQLIEKAHNEQKTVYVHTESLKDAERMDQLLWTFREDSFLPHQIYDTANDNSVPILIGYAENWQRENNDRMLFNISNAIPTFYSQFNHVIEIVFSDPVVQQLARERFKQYRDQGCEMNTYKIKVNEL